MAHPLPYHSLITACMSRPLHHAQRQAPAGPSSLAPPDRFQDDSASSSDPISTPVHLSQQSSRNPSPFVELPHPDSFPLDSARTDRGRKTEEEQDDDDDFDAWDEEDPLTDTTMPSDLRSPFHRPVDGKTKQPLLPADKQYNDYASPHRPLTERRSARFHERDPEVDDKNATRRRYTYAGFFLILSLISFTIQTETAVYIQHNLKWNKAYCMLWVSRMKLDMVRGSHTQQLLHAQLMVRTMAYATSNHPTIEVECAMADRLATTHPKLAYYRSND